MAAKKEKPDRKLIAQNRRAWHDYAIEDTFEAGLILTGSEVKSLRAGRASIGESHIALAKGAFWLFNAHIQAYEHTNPRFQHEARRQRQLLLHKDQIRRMIGLVQRKGAALVPMELYFNSRGIAKLLVGLAAGKKQHDKRETARQRDWDRQKARLLRNKGKN